MSADKGAADAAAIEAAIAGLLAACGLDGDHPDLRETPRRVAELWQAEFLWGYQQDPKDILAGGIESRSTDAICVRGLAFHGLCPHHLLPMQGVAHLAYLPQERIVGFGQLGRLVHCFTQRLILQEHATSAIANALLDELGASGAGCVLVARHSCLGIPGDRHSENEITSSCFLGELRSRPDLQDRLLNASRHGGLSQFAANAANDRGPARQQ